MVVTGHACGSYLQGVGRIVLATPSSLVVVGTPQINHKRRQRRPNQPTKRRPGPLALARARTMAWARLRYRHCDIKKGFGIVNILLKIELKPVLK